MKLKRAKTTVMGGEKFGMAEVVAEALLAWIFDSREGEIYLATEIDGGTRQCCLSLPRIPRRKPVTKEIDVTYKVTITYRP